MSYREDTTAGILWKKWVDVRTSLAFHSVESVKAALANAKFKIRIGELDTVYYSNDFELVGKHELRRVLNSVKVNSFHILCVRGASVRYIYNSGTPHIYCKNCENTSLFHKFFKESENVFYCDLCGYGQFSPIEPGFMSLD